MTATVGERPRNGLLLPNPEDIPSDNALLASSAPENSDTAVTSAAVPARPRSVQRMYSESDADPSNLAKLQKKSRRRRGKGRWKPYHNMTTEEKLAKDARDEKNALQKRARLFSHGKPMAPYNTTQFLLEDREKRVTADSDGDSVNGITAPTNGHGWGSPTQNRCRELSGSDPGGNSSESGSVSGEDDEMEREFEADYDTANFERINGMSREEVTKEMILLERSNGRLADEVGDLRWENEKLKKLLIEHNIAFDEVFATKRRRSGDSVTSDNSVSMT